MSVVLAGLDLTDLGFGHGLHFCLGANLARLEIWVLYEELFARFSGIEGAGSEARSLRLSE
jgi:cytochrome P450